MLTRSQIIFFIILLAFGSLCQAQSDSSSHKLKRYYFGIEVSPLVSFKVKAKDYDEFKIVHYNRELTELNKYNNKFNKVVYGYKFAVSNFFRLYKSFYFKSGFQFSQTGYKTNLIDTLNQTAWVYNKSAPSNSKINGVSFVFKYQYFNVPIQLSYMKKINNGRFVLYTDLGVELSVLLKYTIDVNNYLIPSENEQYNYVIKRFIKSGSEYPTNYIFRSNYFVFYRVNTGVSYLLKNQKIISTGLSYSLSAPVYGLNSSLANLSLDLRYNF